MNKREEGLRIRESDPIDKSEHLIREFGIPTRIVGIAQTGEMYVEIPALFACGLNTLVLAKVANLPKNIPNGSEVQINKKDILFHPGEWVRLRLGGGINEDGETVYCILEKMHREGGKRRGEE